MNLDAFSDFIQDHLDIAVRNGEELRLAECLFCGYPRTMKVNVRNGRFFCYRKDCHERGGHIQLLMVILGCSLDEATHRFTQIISTERRTDLSNDELRDRVRVPRPRARPVERPNPDLPRGFCPLYLGDDEFEENRYLEYLTDVRDVSLDSIERWGIGYVDTGLLEGRVVVPVRTDGTTGWVARLVSGEGPRYRTPPKMPNRLLFGYDEVPERPELLVACEGTFDAIRLWSYGIPTVGYLKDGLSLVQVQLLERLRPRRLVQFPDIGDRNAQARAIRTALEFQSRFEDFSVVAPKRARKIDPDSGPRDEVEALIQAARPPRPADLLRFKLAPTE